MTDYITVNQTRIEIIPGMGMAKRYVILWPEKRSVTAAQVHWWWLDAVADGEISDDATSIDHEALALHHAGIITLKSN